MGTQENTIYALAAAGAIVLGTLTVVFSSALFGVALGGVVSAGAGYFFSSRSWKRTVKRENALKNNELLYSPLSKEIGAILDRCNGFSYRTKYNELTYPEWNRIRGEPQYRFVASILQGQLSEFYKEVDKFNSNLAKIHRVVPNFIVNQAAKFFNLAVAQVSYMAKDSKTVLSSVYLDTPILFDTHPREILEHDWFDRANLSCYLTLGISSGTNVDFDKPEQIDQAEEFYKKVSGEIRNFEEVKGLKKALGEIVKKGPGIRDSLFHVIEKTAA